MKWDRYTMFYILYPLGIGAEWWLMYLAIEPLSHISSFLPPNFYFLLALYGPGTSQLISSHLISPLPWSSISISIVIQTDRDGTSTNIATAGAYKMFTHMVKQRRKVLGKK
jgi:hypothetical protein